MKASKQTTNGKTQELGYKMKASLRSFGKNEAADTAMIGGVIGILITLIIAVLVFYNVAGNIDTTSIDADFSGTPSANATEAVLDQAATFFTIAPIIAIVVVAVVVLKYVGQI